MTWATELSTIRQLLRSNWTTTEIAWPGEHYEPPARSTRSSPAAFVEVVVNHNPSQQRGMSTTGLRNNPGLITLMIQTQDDVGDYLLRTYADTLSGIFRDTVTADRIWFGEPSYRFHGPWGEWTRADLDIPFKRLKSFGVTDAADLAGAVSDTQTVSQAAHGFAVGDWITYDTAAAPDVWSKAVADGVANLEVVGVVSKVQDTATFNVTTGGSVVIPAHGETLGTLWLNTSTPGAVVTLKPTSVASPGAFARQTSVATTADRITVTQVLAIRL
jgi:hypothetical protein